MPSWDLLIQPVIVAVGILIILIKISIPRLKELYYYHFYTKKHDSVEG